MIHRLFESDYAHDCYWPISNKRAPNRVEIFRRVRMLQFVLRVLCLFFQRVNIYPAVDFIFPSARSSSTSTDFGRTGQHSHTRHWSAVCLCLVRYLTKAGYLPFFLYLFDTIFPIVLKIRGEKRMKKKERLIVGAETHALSICRYDIDGPV